MIPFLEKVQDYCDGITPENFSGMYSGLEDIVKEYNLNGLSKSVIEEELLVYLRSLDFDPALDPPQLDIYKDEVVSEVLSCIVGYTSPAGKIDLIEFVSLAAEKKHPERD